MLSGRSHRNQQSGMQWPSELLVLSPGSLTIAAQVRTATDHPHLPNPARVSQALESLL